MLTNKYFKKTLKLIHSYAAYMRDYRIIISNNHTEIKLSYKLEKDGKLEQNWIATENPVIGERMFDITEVYYSIKNELENRFPHIQ